MQNRFRKFLKLHWPKFLLVFLFILLFSAYGHIFARDSKYSPGQTLDPTDCSPGEENCTVEIGGGGSSGWSLTGDSGTSIGTNFIGTTDDVDLQFRRNNVVAGQIGTMNTSYGLESLYSNTTGYYNTANGSQSLYSNTTGSNNTANGYASLLSNTTGSQNTANGNSSLYSNTTGDSNTANGFYSLYSNTAGLNNTASGIFSLTLNTTGSQNTANGNSSLYSNTTGDSNTANGYASLLSNTTGYQNTANGYQSLLSNTIGYLNTANGDYSLYYNTDGTYNIGLGHFAGQYISDGVTPNTTGDYNIFLGSSTKALADDDQNEIVIGYNATGNGSDTTTIGNTSTLRTYLTGLNLKAGTSTAGTAPLKFTSSAGTLLGTTEAGAVEYDGTHLYFTAVNAGTRYQLDQQSGGGGGLSSDADFNTKGGTDAGLNLVSGAQYNTFLGYEAGMSAGAGGTNGADYNTAIGYQSLFSNTTGDSNTANGTYSLYSNTTGSANTANGMYSLYSNTTGTANTANGAQSLSSNTTGGGNTANGMYSLTSNTNGYYNNANGYGSLKSNTTGYKNTANGYGSLANNITGVNNIGLGDYSGSYISGGSINNTTGDYNIFIGSETKALADNDQNEIVIGYNATGNGSDTATIGNTSTLRTYLAGLNLKAGTATAGTAPLKFTSSAGSLLGTTEAGAVEYDGSHLYFTATDLGTRFQLDQQGGGGLSSDADFNTKGGTDAGLNLVSGAQYNTFLGYEAGKSANDTYSNTAIGYRSLYSNTDGWANTANGSESLFYNTTGDYNTANGMLSLRSNISGSENTANGMSSLQFNTIGNSNTANGQNSLFINTTGSQNTANGTSSLASNTTGTYNVGLGYEAGRYISGDIANTTGDYNIFLGSDTKALADNDQNEIVIGYNATGNGSNTTTIGTGNVLYVGGTGIGTESKVARFTNISGYCDITPVNGGVSCSSDMNLKKNITTLGEDKEFALQTIPDLNIEKTTLEKIMEITPVNYNWNAENNNDTKHIGFIAQEMEQIFPSIVSTDTNGTIDPITGKVIYLKSISYASITPYLVKAIQEMNLKIEDLSSLDTTSATSLGSLIGNFLSDATNNLSLVFFGEVHTKKLCLDDLCITKDQLQQILKTADGVENSGNTNIKTPQVVIPPPVVTPPSTPIVVTPPANNPAPVLTPEEKEAKRLADLEIERLANEKATADKAKTEADKEAERLAKEAEKAIVDKAKTEADKEAERIANEKAAALEAEKKAEIPA